MAADPVAFSNPTAPTEENEVVHPKKLSNADFRSILMTPRAGRDELNNSTTMQPPKKIDHDKKKLKKHKHHKKPETKSDKQTNLQILKQYRDRAKERRDGKVPSGIADGSPENNAGGQYRAVSGNKLDNIALAETRKQQIEKSKFLGGDPNTTHLVRGLDYVLLEKTRNQALIQAEKSRTLDFKKSSDEIKINVEEEYQSPMCKKVVQLLFDKQPIIRNQNFYPGKMAYRIDLEDDYAEFDVPTTIHRSLIECKLDDYGGVMSSNQNVISSLTNILSYLRGERKQAKKAKLKEKVEERDNKEAVDKDYDMFVDLPEANKKSREDRRKTHSERHTANHNSDRRHSEKDKKSKYFDKSIEEGVPHDRLEKTKLYIQNLEKRNIPNKEAYEKQLISYLKEKTATSGYDECYPELLESFDAMDDESDTEVDYTKMDMGNKKGPVGRWDFDNQEEYSKYMSNKEALPKAVFQYGVKMADGRKTRRIHGNKDGGDKAALEKEWRQIQEIWKTKGTSGGEQPLEKKAKMG